MAEGRYTRIKSKFWTDEKVKKWDSDTKFLALYLLTSPHKNMLGCYVLSKLYICADLEWDMKRLGKPFTKLLDQGFINYDDDNELILLTNFLKHNPLENGNQVKAAISLLSELPQSPLLKDLERLVEQLDKPFTKPLLERLGKQVTVTVTVTEKVLVGDHDKKSPENNKPQKNKYADFETFWKKYPKKKSKGQAEKTWKNMKPDTVLVQEIMSGLEKAIASYDWKKEGGKFIPYPATWLNAKGWLDEYSSIPFDKSKPQTKPRAPSETLSPATLLSGGDEIFLLPRRTP